MQLPNLTARVAYADLEDMRLCKTCIEINHEGTITKPKIKINRRGVVRSPRDLQTNTFSMRQGHLRVAHPSFAGSSGRLMASVVRCKDLKS